MAIKNIVIDCDGVLTDGKKYVGPDGEREMVAFHARDNEAIKLLQDDGLRVIIVTASRFSGIRRYWMNRGVEVFSLPGHKTRLAEEAGIDWSETIGVGDDLIDVGFLNKCAQGYVVADAHPQMRQRFPVLRTRGGYGIMAEVYEKLAFNYQLNGTNTIA